MKNPRKEYIYIVLTALGLIVLIFSTLWYLSLTDIIQLKFNPKKIGPTSLISQSSKGPLNNKFKFEKFNSERDFTDYLAQSEASSYGLGFGITSLRSINLEGLSGPVSKAAPNVGFQDSSFVERFSETNVQVAGIDEPDILKSSGSEIYFSPQQRFYQIEKGLMPERILPPQPLENPDLPEIGETQKEQQGVLVVNAFPPSDLKIDSRLKASGDLLLSETNLIIFSGKKIIGYNVADPSSPDVKWTLNLKDNTEIVSSRLYNGRIYVIQRKVINTSRPCPIEILSGPKGLLSIPCRDIYHPSTIIPTDVTYTAMIINPDSGEITKTVSFIGSQSSSVTYMSRKNLYLTFYSPGDLIEFFYNFISLNEDLFQNELVLRIGKLMSYDLTQSGKINELFTLLEQYLAGLDNEERMEKENEFTNRMSDYTKEHKREIDRTGIVKINLDNFSISAQGLVPGMLLNQFSLDEYEDNLRVATTVGSSFFTGSGESSNDVYVLNKDLSTSGMITDLGLSEKIYSARFVEDKAYVVTFRQTDPFYVLDLSDSRNPIMAGELKIPGFSSYLHPISKNLILGVGEESGKVKLSLFDVEDSSSPQETDKYNLEDYWSEVRSTQHAFQIDQKYSVFFLPGSRGGYIFSFRDNKLKLVKAVSDITARRAIYINNYFYVVGDNKIVVLDEASWEKINELDLD